MRTRGARCILTTRRDGSDRARRGGVDHARRDGADRARRDERRRPPQPQQRATTVRPRPAAPGVRFRFRARWVPFPGGRQFSWCFLGGPRGHGDILCGKLFIGHGAIHRLKKKMHSDHAERCALRIKVRANGCAVSVRRHGADGARRDDADGAGRRRGDGARRRRGDGAERRLWCRDSTGRFLPVMSQKRHIVTVVLA